MTEFNLSALKDLIMRPETPPTIYMSEETYVQMMGIRLGFQRRAWIKIMRKRGGFILGKRQVKQSCYDYCHRNK